MSSAGPRLPIFDPTDSVRMSLSVLQRRDRAVEELLATAGHVALYDFDIPTKRWSRKDVEGSLFLVKRRSQPRFQFIILNKKSAVATDNFVEDVHGGFQCEVQKPYVLYRNRANEVVGIWFYDDADCDRISVLLQRIASTFSAPAEVAADGTAAFGVAEHDVAASRVGGNSKHSSVDMGASSKEDGFWDLQVAAPSAAAKGGFLQEHHAPEEAHEQPTAIKTASQPTRLVLEQPLHAAGVHNSAPGGNELTRLFAGIKMGPSASAAALLQPAMAGGPGPAPGRAVVPLVLLTPQLLQQEAAGARPEADTKAGAGSALLQSLQRGSIQQQRHPRPASFEPAAQPVAITANADQALRSKIAAVLVRLAANESFCDILAGELERMGMTCL